VIRFRPLQVSDLVRIVGLQLQELTSLLAEQGLSLEVEEGVADALARQGYEPEYGARPLRRVLRRQVENPLATLLLEERFAGATGVKIAVGSSDGEPLRFMPQTL
jgi:ATP-dependent Clp protease ATP-binding subunit ClpA